MNERGGLGRRALVNIFGRKSPPNARALYMKIWWILGESQQAQWLRPRNYTLVMINRKIQGCDSCVGDRHESLNIGGGQTRVGRVRIGAVMK